MASVITRDNGRREISFTFGGKRQTVRLGTTSIKIAERIQRHIEHLVAARTAGTAIDREQAAWLAEIADELHGKLAKAGLVVERGSATLGAFLSTVIQGRADVKPGTVTNYRQVERCLVEFFGKDKPLRDITPGDADDFRRWLATWANVREKDRTDLADNTVRRRVGRAREFFRVATRRRLIDANPFDGIAAAVNGNPDRMYFVPAEWTQRLLDASPDADWKCIITLARIGGLRCPSEILALRWGDIDWHEGRFVVTSSKTERHAGKGTRAVPLFPELRVVLAEARELAADGTMNVVNRYRDAGQNLRTTLLKIIKRAGLTPWPRLFQNLRSSRETELVDEYPIHKACAWIGNSQAVARRHYLQVRDEDFRRAADCAAQDTQNAQRCEASPAFASAEEKPQTAEPCGFATVAEPSQRLAKERPVTRSGLERVTASVSGGRGLGQGANEGAAESAAFEADAWWRSLTDAERVSVWRRATIDDDEGVGAS